MPDWAIFEVDVPFILGTPWKINMKHNNRGLEDYFPLQIGDFEIPAVNFQGCTRSASHDS